MRRCSFTLLSVFIITWASHRVTVAYQVYDIDYTCGKQGYGLDLITLEANLASAAILTLSGSTNSHSEQTSFTLPYNLSEVELNRTWPAATEYTVLPSNNTEITNITVIPNQEPSTDASTEVACYIEVKTLDSNDGIFLAVEQVQLKKQKSCQEYVEIAGLTIDGRNRTTKLCGSSTARFYPRASGNRNVYEESFLGNITLRIRADKAPNSLLSPRLRLVMTAFKRGLQCKSKNMFVCNPDPSLNTNSVSYMAAKFGFAAKYTPPFSPKWANEEVCIFKEFVCDVHSNCPLQNRDETTNECTLEYTEPAVVKTKKQASGPSFEVPSVGQLLLGALVFIVAVLSIASCQWVCRKNASNPTSLDSSGSLRDRVRASIRRIRGNTENRTGNTASVLELRAPPPSYEQIQSESDPPPLYESLINMFLHNKTEPMPGMSTSHEDNLPRNSTVITILSNDSSLAPSQNLSLSSTSEMPLDPQTSITQSQRSVMRLIRRPTV